MTIEKLKEVVSGKRGTAVVALLGALGLLLILVSSFTPSSGKKIKSPANAPPATDTDEFCRETEARLEAFLSGVEGLGEVKVYLTVDTDERYVYAKEARKSRSENKFEEEEKYVLIGGGTDKSALIETVMAPEITGAVIACAGGDEPAARERAYKAVSAALGIPTGKVYVTKLK